MTDSANALISWLSTNGLPLAVGVIVVALAYRWIRPVIHGILERALKVQTDQIGDDPLLIGEATKRLETIEDLLDRLLRLALIFAIVIVVLAVFDLWPVLAGLGLIVAGITLAGQSIVLDYLMGFLIITEGQYYKGDVIEVNGVSGTVEDVGLRRTTIRAADGTVYSISNGEIRLVANRTRVFAAAEVIVPGIREEDLERVLAVMDRVGQDLASDPAFAASVIEAPKVQSLGDPDDLGMSATMRGKVAASERWTIATEIRRRLNRAFLEEGIELNKRGVVGRRQRSIVGPAESDEDDDDGV